MICLMRSGFNVKCMKEEKWMPVIRRSLDKFHSTIRKASKRKTKQEKVTEAVPPVKVEEKDVPEKGEVKNCEKCHAMNEGDERVKEKDGTEKESQNPENQTVRKSSYPKISDFLIRNIMSFPIQGPSETAEEEHQTQTEDSKFSSFPSVTTILSETMSLESRRFLEKWKQNLIAKMGQEKFSEMQKATLSRGSKFHGAIRKYLMGSDIADIKVDENVEGCWKSVTSAFPHISNVKLVETCVYHPYLHYKGIVDCVASFKNVPHVIEWKQSEKAKKNLQDTYDAPIQLCAYMGAMPWCKSVHFSEPITNGLVVVAYVDGSPADIFTLDSEYCQRYWLLWLRRVQKFWLMHSPELKESLCQ